MNVDGIAKEKKTLQEKVPGNEDLAAVVNQVAERVGASRK